MLRVWRFITVLLAALSMGMAFGHALEFIPKMEYSGPLYLTVQRTLYALFGAPLGASIEVAVLASSVSLFFLVRRPSPAFLLTASAAGCMVVAHAIWWMWVNPANTAFFHMVIHNPDPDWQRWRSQWEYAHLTRFLFQFISLVLLLLSVILEIPARDIVVHENRHAK